MAPRASGPTYAVFAQQQQADPLLLTERDSRTAVYGETALTKARYTAGRQAPGLCKCSARACYAWLRDARESQLHTPPNINTIMCCRNLAVSLPKPQPLSPQPQLRKPALTVQITRPSSLNWHTWSCHICHTSSSMDPGGPTEPGTGSQLSKACTQSA
jgi:hypothetical protein